VDAVSLEPISQMFNFYILYVESGGYSTTEMERPVPNAIFITNFDMVKFYVKEKYSYRINTIIHPLNKTLNKIGWRIGYGGFTKGSHKDRRLLNGLVTSCPYSWLDLR